MGMDLAVKEFRCEPEYCIAGATIPITTAVKEAGVNLPVHAPVLLADGKASLLTAPAEDGLYGITAGSAEKGEDVVIYLAGEFFADGLALPEGVTAADLDIAFRNIGIFLK